jgi:hypothetical protein
MVENALAENELETHDIYFAAYLIVTGCEMLRTRRQGQRVYFIFRNPAGPIADLKKSYFMNEATVKAHQFAQQIAAVKKMLF